MKNLEGRVMSYKYLFGPVNSRRLGLSLGIDLVPYKVCTLDCVYCEVGKTTDLTLTRDAYFSLDEIIAELSIFLAKAPKIDFITFSGAGEPTLNSEMGEIIRVIKNKWPYYRLALITNSTLLSEPSMIKDLLPCDLILPSLDAVSIEAFKKINRPHQNLIPEIMIESLIELRRQFRNQIWLEIFFLEGINDNPSELRLLKDACEKINPDRIQINALDRPGAVDWVKKVSDEKLLEILDFFKPLPAELIARVSYQRDMPQSYLEEESIILKSIENKSFTMSEIAKNLNFHYNTIQKHVRLLVEKNIIKEIKLEDKLYYIKQN